MIGKNIPKLFIKIPHITFLSYKNQSNPINHPISRYQQSLEAADKVVHYCPQGAWGYFRRALANIALGEREKATMDLNQALSLWPEFEAAKNELDRLKN
jgi:tetratricopeptide (TPR) repeat protein